MDKSRREDEGCPPLAIGQDSPGGSAQEHSTDHIHFSSEETQLQHCHQEQEQSSYYTQPGEEYGQHRQPFSDLDESSPLHERESERERASLPSSPPVLDPQSIYSDVAPPSRGGVPTSEFSESSAPDSDSDSDSSSSAAAVAAAVLVSVKLLVSNNVAGSIIGRSGQTISELQARSSARIKLSQAGDCFPGTSDRVCLVQGSLKGVTSAVELILTKLHELQCPTQTQPSNVTISGITEVEDSTRTSLSVAQVNVQTGEVYAPSPASLPSFAFIIRVLVPTPSCGMLIGRGGANVKSMAESSGVTSIRLSPKENEAILAATSERVVTITSSTLIGAVRCVGLIVDGMSAHPDISRYANMTTSYSRASSVLSAAQQAATAAAALASSSMSGSFVQGTIGMGVGGGISVAPTAPSSSVSAHRSSLEVAASRQSSLQQASLSGGLLGLQSSQAQQVPQGHTQLRYAPIGRSEDRGAGTSLGFVPPPPPPSPVMVSSPPMAALPPLSSACGAAAFGQAHGSYLPSASSSLASQQQQSIYVLASNVSSATAAGRDRPDYSHISSSSSGVSSVMDQFSSVQVSGLSSGHSGSDTSHQQLPYIQGLSASTKPSSSSQRPLQGGGSSASIQIAVPDTLIGAILGRDGQTLKELQISTGTRIKISQRGVFVPGTNHRVVTLTGPSPESVAAAQFMIGQRLAARPRTDHR